jgi:hypothetical protein
MAPMSFSSMRSWEEQRLPKLFEIGKYSVYFWSNEKHEPVHIHVSEGRAAANATKIWLTRSGGFIVSHNKGNIPQRELNSLLELLLVHYFYIISEWKRHFSTDTITFYC